MRLASLPGSLAPCPPGSLVFWLPSCAPVQVPRHGGLLGREPGLPQRERDHHLSLQAAGQQGPASRPRPPSSTCAHPDTAAGVRGWTRQEPFVELPQSEIASALVHVLGASVCLCARVRCACRSRGRRLHSPMRARAQTSATTPSWCTATRARSVGLSTARPVPLPSVHSRLPSSSVPTASRRLLGRLPAQAAALVAHGHL